MPLMSFISTFENCHFGDLCQYTKKKTGSKHASKDVFTASGFMRIGDLKLNDFRQIAAGGLSGGDLQRLTVEKFIFFVRRLAANPNRPGRAGP